MKLIWNLNKIKFGKGANNFEDPISRPFNGVQLFCLITNNFLLKKIIFLAFLNKDH